MDEMDVADDGDIPLPQQHLFLDQAKQYNFVAVREMLEASPGLVNVQPAMRWSALHQAAEAGDEAAVSFLLERGADKTLKTKDGRTPLQVTKNAAVRALLGGEKRTAPEGPAEGASPKAAKVSALSLVLKVNYAASGAELASLTWSSKGSVEDLKEELRKKLEPGKVVRTLLKENYPLPDGTLEDAGVENGAILNAVIDVEPILFLFKPCTASELCSRHQDWCAGEEEDLVQSERAHLAMDQAPEVARKVAEELNEACPGLGGFQVCRSSEGDSPGELLVIANAGEDPKKSCLKALVFPKDSEEWQDKVDENDPECTGLWALATLEKVEWKDYLDKGFNAHKDDDPETMVADGLSSEELEEYRKATKIMNEKLEKHFIFNFSDDAQVAPMIWGGYASDGCIVGIISGRVWT